MTIQEKGRKVNNAGRKALPWFPEVKPQVITLPLHERTVRKSKAWFGMQYLIPRGVAWAQPLDRTKGNVVCLEAYCFGPSKFAGIDGLFSQCDFFVTESIWKDLRYVSFCAKLAALGYSIVGIRCDVDREDKWRTFAAANGAIELSMIAAGLEEIL